MLKSNEANAYLTKAYIFLAIDNEATIRALKRAIQIDPNKDDYCTVWKLNFGTHIENLYITLY